MAPASVKMSTLIVSVNEIIVIMERVIKILLGKSQIDSGAGCRYIINERSNDRKLKNKTGNVRSYVRCFRE